VVNHAYEVQVTCFRGHTYQQEFGWCPRCGADTDAEAGELREALEQADRWILYRPLVRDGACAECFPGSDIPPAFAGFRCAWHHAQARAALARDPGEGRT
jgi:hypothetical protein